MEIKYLREALHEWRRERKGEHPSAISIHPSKFDELASDRESHKYIELFEIDGRIISHSFMGIPLVITTDTESFKIYSEEEHKKEIEKERRNMSL